MQTPSLELGRDAQENGEQGTKCIELLLLPSLVDIAASPISTSTFSHQIWVETLTGLKLIL